MRPLNVKTLHTHGLAYSIIKNEYSILIHFMNQIPEKEFYQIHE